MATWTVAGLVPVNIPLSVDTFPIYAWEEMWTLADEPFASELAVGQTIDRIAGSMNVTANAANAGPMLVRIYKPDTTVDPQVFKNIGYVNPGETATLTFDVPVGASVSDTGRLVSLYFNQTPPGRTQLEINSLSFDFQVNVEAVSH